MGEHVKAGKETKKTRTVDPPDQTISMSNEGTTVQRWEREQGRPKVGINGYEEMGKKCVLFLFSFSLFSFRLVWLSGC